MIIEKNIAMVKKYTDYPFDKMDVGDSIFVDGQTSAGNAAMQARTHGYRKGLKFSARKEGSGVRIWRTA